MKLSFIIPSYNAAAYLMACLDSIYSLDIKEYGREVIVVNDGSEDNTAALLEEYRLKHDDIVVITQENSGLSMARNAGIDKATGDYVCFVDADDILRNVDVSAVLSVLTRGIDVVSIDMVERNECGKVYPYRRYITPYNKVFCPAKHFMKGRNLMPCAVTYLYRKAFLDSNNLRFLPGVYHEDEEFTPRVFALAKSFYAVPVVLYERILRKESITTTTDKGKQQKKLRDMVAILRRLDIFAHENEERFEAMKCKLSYLTVDILRLLLREKHDREFRNEILRELKIMGYFPLPWRWNYKYIAFNILTRYFLV